MYHTTDLPKPALDLIIWYIYIDISVFSFSNADSSVVVGGVNFKGGWGGGAISETLQ